MSEFTQLGDRYDIGQVVGRGGMAEVYEGTDRRLNRRVAIKVLRADLARDPMFQERFRREAQSAAGLNHPNIVAIYDTGQDTIVDGTTEVQVPYIVMEFVDGVTLRQMLARGPRILPERSLEISAGILAALDYAHRHGIVHRDIKPANIMINSNGDAKVMDFGIARAMSDAASSVTATSAVMGTAQYLSPEQARGELVDARSDIYSTGCVLFELLTGATPFTGESPVSIAYQHVNEIPKAPSQVDPSIPATLDAIVLHSLAKQPNSRYQSAAEMRADVERAMAGMPIMASVNAHTSVIPITVQDAVINNSLLDFASESTPKKNTMKWVGAAAASILALALIVFAGQQLFGSGISKVTVPTLTTKTIDEAKTSLENVALTLGTETPKNDENAPKGTIIGQDPAAGELLEQGQKVNVTVSIGKEQAIVPDLVDQSTVEDARALLIEAKLVLGKVTYVDNDKPEGTVTEQSPKPSSTLDIGSRVDVVISSGKVPVPTIVGKTKVEANAILVNAGFKVQVLYDLDENQVGGIVLAQSPSSGMALKGTTVTITVNKTVATPSVTPSISVTPSLSPTPSTTTTPVR